MNYIILSLIPYLIGSFPTAFLVVKLKYDKNILRLGSGNMGATNVLVQTGSKIIALLVGLIDALKGYLACLIIYQLTGNQLIAGLLGGSLAIIGHNYSFIMRFKGGKGVATSIGALIFISPLSALIFSLTALINRTFWFKFRISKLEIYEVLNNLWFTALITYLIVPETLMAVIIFKLLNLLKYITNHELKKEVGINELISQFKK